MTTPDVDAPAVPSTPDSAAQAAHRAAVAGARQATRQDAPPGRDAYAADGARAAETAASPEPSLADRPRPGGSSGGRSGLFSAEEVRAEFPALHRTVNGQPLAWLDNGATTHKPHRVIEALTGYYSYGNSNIHRGAHTMAREATEAYEASRAAVAGLLGASSAQDVVFVRGTTEAVNLVAQTWGRDNLGPGDDILVPVLEHHSNLVPWQLLARRTRARVVPVPLLPDGRLDQDAYADLLSLRTRLVVVSHVSNVLGTVQPVREMTALAHRYGARVLVDGAQAVAHMPVDVAELDADFYAFSGHKVFAPTGIGALYAKPELLAELAPWQGGGNMIEHVGFDGTEFAPAPHRLEAGTGHIAGAVGLLAALEWLTSLDRDGIAAHEARLTSYAQQALGTVPGLTLLGSAPDRVAVLTFTLAGHDPAHVADWLDRNGIAVRSGHHCAQPSLAHFGVTSATRASLALYNTAEEVDRLVAALHALTSGEDATPPPPSQPGGPGG